MFLNVCKQTFHILSRVHISKRKRCFNAKFSTYFFHMKIKILADFQIYISVPFSKAIILWYRGWTFCSLLVNFCSLLVTFCSLLVIFFCQNYFEVKLLWTAKKWFDYNETPLQIFPLQISEVLVTFSKWWFSKFSQHAKPFWKLT